MSALDSLTTCRRKALLFLGLGVVILAMAFLAHAADLPIGDQFLGILAGFGVGAVFSSVLLWFMPDSGEGMPKSLIRRYFRDVIPAMVGYIAVMLVWKKLLGWVESPALRVLVALLPALLIVWIMRAFVRYVAGADELQRRIELESGAVAGLVVSAVYMAAGFLQTANLIDVPSKVAMLWVFPLLCFTYGISKVFVARRYS